MKIRRIEKRDGRAVPFDKQKIAAAVARAQAAVGENDPQAANDVADIVEMALARRYLGERTLVPNQGETLPGIEEIQDLVERALVELGHAAVAKAYILYRDRRAQIRAALESRSDALRAEQASDVDPAKRSVGTRGPRVQVSGGLETWRKSRIVAALMDEADLPRTSAEEVAARVEERVFALGVARLSTALIRELVDNELVELGLSKALRRQRPVGLPRHDLRRIVGARRGDPAQQGSVNSADVNDRVAAEILRRYALEDVLTERVAEQHLSGEIFVEDLERPHQALTSAIPCDLLVRGEPSARAAFEMLDDLGDLARSASQGIVLEDPLALGTLLSRSARGGGLGAFLAALSGLARASKKRIDLSFAPGQPRASSVSNARGPSTNAPSNAAFLQRLVEELAALEDDGRVRAMPRVYLDSRDLLRLCDVASPSFLRNLDALLARGQVVPTWTSGRTRCVGPALRRNPRERGVLHCGGSVALNLPRAARRAGPWREDALLENLATQVESALDALACLREFQRADEARAFPMRGRVSYALAPVGLREALRWLGDGEIRPEQGTRVLAFLVEATSRFAAARGLVVALTPAFGERAAARFAELDPQLFHTAQPLLFESALPSSAAQRGEPYSTGFELAPVDPGLASDGATLAPAEVALVEALDCGVLHPPSILRTTTARANATPHPALDTLEILERARTRQREGAPALYALPPAPKEFEIGDVSDAMPFDSNDDPNDLAPARTAASLYPDADASGFGRETSLRRVRSDDSRPCD